MNRARRRDPKSRPETSNSRGLLRFLTHSVAIIALALLALGPAQAMTPETVRFDAADGKTELTAYLYKPDGPGPHPAVVALHGRSGLFSNRGRAFDAEHLAKQKKMWGEFWAERGYLVLFVDSFGPRGYPAGFAAGTIGLRPPSVNEISVRPLDAYAGLRYLRTRADVERKRVFLQGWSNGGSAALSAMAVGAPGKREGEEGFRAAIAVYPGCVRAGKTYGPKFRTYAPLLLLIGTRDEEVKPAACAALAELAKANGSDLDFVMYEGAEHSYDTPIARRQRLPANAAAGADTRRRAEEFFARYSD